MICAAFRRAVVIVVWVVALSLAVGFALFAMFPDVLIALTRTRS